MIRCGIIGMGKMGNIRAQEIFNNPETELTAIYDISKEKMASFEMKKCKNINDFFAVDLDAIFICTYNNVNAEYSIRSLETGRHVFCEKPPAKSVSEVKTVIEAEKKSKKILKYGFNHRYHYSVMEAKKLLDSGMFGRLLWLRGIYGKAGGNLFKSNWRNKLELSGGGILIDQGIHMLDLMQFFSPPFIEVKSMVQTLYWDVPVEDNVFAILKTYDGVMATLHSSATQWRHRFNLDMCFEDGYINLEGILSSTRSYGDETLIIARKQFEDSTFAIGKPREERIFFDQDHSWRFELEDFINAIKNNQPVEYGKSSDALAVMELIEMIYRESGCLYAN